MYVWHGLKIMFWLLFFKACFILKYLESAVKLAWTVNDKWQRKAKTVVLTFDRRWGRRRIGAGRSAAVCPCRVHHSLLLRRLKVFVQQGPVLEEDTEQSVNRLDSWIINHIQQKQLFLKWPLLSGLRSPKGSWSKRRHSTGIWCTETLSGSEDAAGTDAAVSKQVNFVQKSAG